MLLDDYMVGDRWGRERVLHQPDKFLRNPVLLKDKPWEGDVTWGGNPDLGRLVGQPVHLRFELRDMGLFSFRVCLE